MGGCCKRLVEMGLSAAVRKKSSEIWKSSSPEIGELSRQSAEELLFRHALKNLS